MLQILILYINNVRILNSILFRHRYSTRFCLRERSEFHDIRKYFIPIWICRMVILTYFEAGLRKLPKEEYVTPVSNIFILLTSNNTLASRPFFDMWRGLILLTFYFYRCFLFVRNLFWTFFSDDILMYRLSPPGNERHFIHLRRQYGSNMSLFSCSELSIIWFQSAVLILSNVLYKPYKKYQILSKTYWYCVHRKLFPTPEVSS